MYMVKYHHEKFGMKKLTFVFVAILASFYCIAQSQYAFVFLNKKENKDTLTAEARKALMEGHLANINRLAREKKLLVAGPFEGGGGIFILNTTSIDEAKNWLRTDPGIQANRWNLEILPFTLRFGSICEVPETAEMVMYNFVRFTPRITKFNVKTASATLREHDLYVDKVLSAGNGIAEGVFEQQSGGIVIVKGELDKSVVEQSPAVLSSLLTYEIMKLWIAKGSFCER